jgi:hypothetical protein
MGLSFEEYYKAKRWVSANNWTNKTKKEKNWANKWPKGGNLIYFNILFFFYLFIFNQIFFFFDFFFLHFLILSQFDPLAARSKDSSHLNNIEETAAGLLRLVEAMRAVGH